MVRNVLVVEDSDTVTAQIQNELEKYEFAQIFHAKTYKDTMKIIRENRANFHAAILDLNLPDAPNGEIVSVVASHYIPIVVLTGILDKSLKKSILKKEVIDFVIKEDTSSIPFAVNSVVRVLKNYDTNVLVVDDSPLYRKTISDSLKTININVIEAEDGQMALDMIEQRNDIPLVITDYEMPNMNGMDLTFKLRNIYQKDQLGIIALSSLESEEVAYKFLKLGSNDFIHKPFSHNEIITRVNSNLELLDLFSKIKDMANKDFLTGTYNRRYFFESANATYEKAKRKKTNLTVAMVDIDNFKNINDTYGHAVGDLAIKEVKKIFDKNLRISDLVARFGGEEFCILLEDTSIKDAQKLFEKIRISFEKKHYKYRRQKYKLYCLYRCILWSCQFNRRDDKLV